MTSFPSVNLGFGGYIACIPNASTLRNMASASARSKGDAVIVLGNQTAGDALGGVYGWNPISTDNHDGLLTIKPFDIGDYAPGRWRLAVGGGMGGGGDWGGLGTHIIELESQINDPSHGLLALQASITQQNTLYIRGDEALAQQITTLKTSLNGLDISIASKVQEANTSLVNLQQALAQRTVLLEASYKTLGDNAAATIARIAAEEAARATSVQATTTRIISLEANYTSVSNGLTLANARIVENQTATANALQSLASRTTTLESLYQNGGGGGDGSGGDNSALLARIAAEEQTRADEDEALAQTQQQLSSQFGDLDTRVTGVTTDVSANTDALAQQILRGDGLQTVLDARTLINGVSAAALIQNLQTTVTTQNQSFAQTLSLLGASVNGGSAFQLNAASVVASDGTALATKLSSLEASIGSAAGGITNLQQVVVDPSGITARAMVQLDVNGNISGTYNTNTGGQSSYIVKSNIFQIIDPNGGTPVTPFSIANNVVSMTNVVVDTLKVNTAITAVKAVASSAIAGSYSSKTGTAPRSAVMTTAIVVPAAGWVKLDLTLQQNFTGSIDGETPWSCGIAVDGAEIGETLRGGTVPGDAVFTSGAIYLAAGTHTIAAMWGGHTSINLLSRFLFGMGLNNTI